MTPVNPQYSKKARCLKNSLIECATGYQMVRLSKFIPYLKGFWKAILQENFIFSFKNTLEMSVYSDLDAQRSKWFWNFRKQMIKCEDDFETELHRSKEADDVATEPYQRLQKEVFQTLQTTYSEIVCDVEKYFKEHTHRDILINWKSETERLLKRLRDELKEHAKHHCKQVWHNKQARTKLNEIKNNHRTVISKRVRDLVSHLSVDREKEPLTVCQLQVKFEEQWSEWIRALVAQLPYESHVKQNIDLQIQEALEDHFKRQSSSILMKMNPSDHEGKSLEKWGEKLVLKLKDEHIIKSQPTMAEWFVSFVKKPAWKHTAEHETAHCLQEVQKYLNSKQTKGYNPSFVTEILKLLDSKTDEFRNDVFEFSLEYKMDLALTACGYALKKFKEMEERYKEVNDPVKCLEREKGQYFQDFEDEYSSKAQETIAARQCCELLEGSIRKRVIKSLSVRVVEKMKDDDGISFLFRKETLIKQVLVKIGSDLQKHDFTTCNKYLRHPSETLEDYVKSFTETYCDGRCPETRLTTYAWELLDENMVFVREAIDAVNRSGKKSLVLWIDEFKSILSTKLIIEGTIRCTLRSVGNTECFNAELKKRIGKMEGNLRKSLVLNAKHMDLWDKKPYDLVYEQVSGCRAACPFCREPCSKSNHDHDGDHEVTLHRPKCLGGWRIRSTGKMSLETCTEAVANDSYFYKSGSDEKHPYRDCESVYPKWRIQRNLPGETSLYWKYVVAHFKSELAKEHNMKEDSVPEDWEKFELSQAIEAL